ncbi:MAG TPA: glycosyltransferase family 2 protein [Jatrophihabitans sp.]|nr:glycosyltransferase family 2 protein [Jatrophihabitans sp.]
MSPPTSTVSAERVNHITAKPSDELSWQPPQRTARLAVGAALLVTLFYMVFLFNPQYRGVTWLWLLVLAAEGLVVVQALLTWWTVLANDHRPDPPEVYAWRRKLARGELTPGIDVFITVYGEPVEIVRGTVRAARDMQVAHNTWVLDDGDSDVIRDMAAAEGVGYRRRTVHDHAKAGNVNAGFWATDGQFMVILDADHVPSPDFLLRALPYMQDPDVAFVQTPQAFPAARGLVSVGTAEAQRIFYELVMPGKNRFNAVFCVGTNVIFRRSALAEIGGMYTASNSEDIWTSLELHRRGWRSVFVPETLARGLAPDNLLSYLKQQFRWSYGGFEVLFRGGLIRRKGLTLDQRVQYLATALHYLLSLAALTFMFVPPLYLLFGFSPIRTDMANWLFHYAPFYVLIVLVTMIQTGGFKPSSMIVSIGAAPVHVRAFVMALLGRKAKWTVTNAVSGGVPGVGLVLPHVALLVMQGAAIAVGVAALQRPDADVTALVFALVWASLYVLLLARVVLEAISEPRNVKERLERRKAGAVLARMLPWPERVNDLDEISAAEGAAPQPALAATH